MKINIEFESWKELCRFLSTANAEGMPEPTKKLTAEELNETAKVAEEIINRAEAKEEAEKKAEKKVEKKAPAKKEEPEEKPEEEEPEEKPAKTKKVDIEALTVKARKALAKVNKETGENTARAWIQEKGFDSLSDIDDPDILDELIGKAEDFLNA